MSVEITFDDHIAARTIWGEARGEGLDGMIAVAYVIRNRMRRGSWGKSAAAVCMAPYQFSCWLPKDPNFRKMLELSEVDLIRCLDAWYASETGLLDVTQGACHYRVTGTPAKWAEGETPVCTIGAHEFFTGIA